nr:hypothetical protein BaRGS_020049 [Batillaria attramentaria]
MFRKMIGEQYRVFIKASLIKQGKPSSTAKPNEAEVQSRKESDKGQGSDLANTKESGHEQDIGQPASKADDQEEESVLKIETTHPDQDEARRAEEPATATAKKLGMNKTLAKQPVKQTTRKKRWCHIPIKTRPDELKDQPQTTS